MGIENVLATFGHKFFRTTTAGGTGELNGHKVKLSRKRRTYWIKKSFFG